MTELRLNDLSLLTSYRTNRNDLLAEFYEPCLGASIAYDRAVGYFRSSVLLLAARPVADFAVRGGKIRLVCSPELTGSDIEAFERGYDGRNELVGQSLIRSIEEALGHHVGEASVRFLATLISFGCLDVRIAFRPGSQGIFHDKVGIFRDGGGHMVSFTGSSNETFNAWDAAGNHEAFDVFCSWTVDGFRVQQHHEYFESLWGGHEPGLEVVPFPDVARERLIEVADPGGIETAYERIARWRSRTTTLPRKILQPHQKHALDSWKRRGRRGLLEHATGSGKTITAISAMREWLEFDRPVLVVVPSRLLLNQWYAEINTELADLDPKLLLAGAGHSLWRREYIVEGFTDSDSGARITLATLQTAAGEEFYSRVRGGEHLLVIVDEVHRAGSPQMSQVFSIDAGARLGLSATPRRYGDPEGTESIWEYFGGAVDPHFTLADAIKAGRLCRYNYHIHPVELSETEMEEWGELTQRIKREVARSHRTDGGDPTFSESTKILLIRRARILKNAVGKIPLAVEVLSRNYEVGQRWLIYCDSQGQLNAVLEALRAHGLPADEYHAAMQGDAEATLDHFSTMGGVLVAIKMLDEGVDIPTIDHALILASSRNSREFIQRRGRVLRVAEDKFFAEIHDALVVPPNGFDAGDNLPSDGHTHGSALLRGELVRAMHFAESAANDTVVMFDLRQLARKASIDLGALAFADDLEEEANDD